jgi:hypothetical protein
MESLVGPQLRGKCGEESLSSQDAAVRVDLFGGTAIRLLKSVAEYDYNFVACAEKPACRTCHRSIGLLTGLLQATFSSAIKKKSVHCEIGIRLCLIWLALKAWPSDR